MFSARGEESKSGVAFNIQSGVKDSDIEGVIEWALLLPVGRGIVFHIEGSANAQW